MGNPKSGDRTRGTKRKPRPNAGCKPRKITLHIGDTFGMLGTKYTVAAILQGNIVRLNYPHPDGTGEIMLKIHTASQ